MGFQLISGPQGPVCLTEREPLSSRDAFAALHPGQLTEAAEDVTWLDGDKDYAPARPPLPLPLLAELNAGPLRVVNRRHPRWKELLTPPLLSGGKKRLHLVAVGDVGGMLLVGLRLLGGDALSAIGIYDLSADNLARWEFEADQVNSPYAAPPPPPVEMISREQLFDCDALVFCASGGVPPLGQEGDVRLAQLEVNSRLVGLYARAAREASFGGLFLVVSDPVDLLCESAWRQSNRDQAGQWDGGGLSTEQVEGYGLGVMWARAAYYARRDSRFADFLTDGGAYGPHGAGLVIANSLSHYDDELSRELSKLAAEANLQARSLGFKPYVAPALSSAAYQILDTLRGRPHLSATRLGRVFFGAASRRGPAGVELLTHPLAPALVERLQYAQSELERLGEGL